MKLHCISPLLFSLGLIFDAAGTPFSYQGRLSEDGGPANGSYDLRFTLFQAAADGRRIGAPISLDDLQVQEGLVNTLLDFDDRAFDGRMLWLQIEVRPGASNGAYTVLSPRTVIGAAPYAQFAIEGNPDPKAIKAIMGRPEPQGAKGNPGATGPVGPQGPQSPAGAAAAKGDKGDKGDPGATGPAGPQGAQGPKGDTGAAGPAGPAGLQGPQGPAGPPGGEEALPLAFVTISGSNPANTDGFGRVTYTYKIGRYEVTNAQYVEFLNAVARVSDPNNVYHSNMGSDPRGGILRMESSFGSSSHKVKRGMGDKPVNFVTFWDACRFCNWLHNGKPNTGVQDASTTEDGAYQLSALAVSQNTVARKSSAKFFVPSEDEWYKAAYYDAEKAGGYWLYATRSDTAPDEAQANYFGDVINLTANVANYARGADWNGQDGNVTTVGSGGSGSDSPWGAFDMAGNVSEWNEARVNAASRGLRGGSWLSFSSSLQSSLRGGSFPTIEDDGLGFRVASP